MAPTTSLDLLRAADPTALLARVATLVPAHATAPDDEAAGGDDEAQAAWLERDGYGSLRSAEPRLSAAMAGGIDRLLAERLPAVFLYVTEPVWVLGERVRRRVSRLLGRPYRLLADAWAWRIAPGERGWPPHRGWASSVFDRAHPELVNVWVALNDVTADRSCIHAVPLDEDPHYPAALDSVVAPLQSVRALPLTEGDALFWNANLLHWGGPCASRALGPRFSCSFSLVREDAVDAIGIPAIEVATLDARARLDLVASQVVIYGEAKPDVSAEVLEWARANVALRGIHKDFRSEPAP